MSVDAPLSEAVLLRAMGAWLPVAWTGDVAESGGDRAVEHVSMGGERSITVLPSRLRSWRVTGGGQLEWWTGLRRVAAGEFGVGPFDMLHPLAARTNLVPRKGAVGGTPAGVVTLDGEPHPVFSTPTATGLIPVLPGVTLRARCIQQGGTLRLSWYDAAGSLIGSATAPGPAVAGWVSVSGAPPDAAVHARVVPFGAALAGSAQARIVDADDGRYYAPAGVEAVYVHDHETSHDWINVAHLERTPIEHSVTILEVSR